MYTNYVKHRSYWTILIMLLFIPPLENIENNILLSLLPPPIPSPLLSLCQNLPDDFLHQQFSIPLLSFLFNTPQSGSFPNISLKFVSLNSPMTSVLINQLLRSEYSSQRCYQHHLAQLTTPPPQPQDFILPYASHLTDRSPVPSVDAFLSH